MVQHSELVRGGWTKKKMTRNFASLVLGIDIDNIKPFRYRHMSTDLNMADLDQTGCFKDNERARKE